MINVIKNRTIWLGISGTLVTASIIAIAMWGLRFGIDYTGGSLLEVRFAGSRPSAGEIQGALAELELGSLIVQPIGEQGALLRFQETSEEKHASALQKLNQLSGGSATGTAAAAVEQLRYDSVGPTIGQELKSKSLSAMILVLIAIVLYIAWAFRRVSRPVESWKYGVAATLALFHDVIITIGVFAVLGRFYNVEIGASFIAAILTVLGYSVNDTIVVFDRIRENLPKSSEDFEGTVNTSIKQTFSRSINTSGTVILTLLAILFFGGASIRDFALALTIGVFVGTYSSIFVASPIVVIWEKAKRG